jgi:hypothetical protein
MDDEQSRPTDEELEAQLRDEIKRLRVADVAGEVMVTLVTLGYQKLTDPETLELRHPDARLAIELLRGLIETLEREQAGDVLPSVDSGVHTAQYALRRCSRRAARRRGGGGCGRRRRRPAAAGGRAEPAAAGRKPEAPAACGQANVDGRRGGPAGER